MLLLPLVPLWHHACLPTAKNLEIRSIMILMFHLTEREPTFNPAHVISLQNLNILFKQRTTAQVKSTVRIAHTICSATLFRWMCVSRSAGRAAQNGPHGRYPHRSCRLPSPLLRALCQILPTRHTVPAGRNRPKVLFLHWRQWGKFDWIHLLWKYIKYYLMLPFLSFSRER